MSELTKEEFERYNKAVNARYAVYYYEINPRTDEEFAEWKKFLQKLHFKYTMLRAMKPRILKRLGVYKKTLREIEKCMEYNVSRSEYIKSRNSIMDEVHCEYLFDKTMDDIREVMAFEYKKTIKTIQKYKDLFEKYNNQ